MNRLKGQIISEVLPLSSNLFDLSLKSGSAFSETTLGKDKSVRYYNLNLTLLKDRKGQMLGHLLLIHDVTEQKRAQEQTLEHQQLVATLQERERLARELHDSVGQVLGYVSMQAQSVHKWLQAGNTEKAESIVSRLSAVAKDAHADVRESILNLKSGSAHDWFFLPTLKRSLDDFQTYYGIHTELIIHHELKDNAFKPGAEVQLFRVIQEALTNAHKHSGAHNVRVAIERAENRGVITITDDGGGFDINQVNPEVGRHFGLTFMNERMAEIGGFMKIESRAGTGTIVKLEAPLQNQ